MCTSIYCGILTCFIVAFIIPLSYGFILYSDGISYWFSHSINPLCCFCLLSHNVNLLGLVQGLSQRDETRSVIDGSTGNITISDDRLLCCWCCRCWACALTVQNICHKFTFIWPNAVDRPPAVRLRPGFVLPMPLPRLQSNGFCANAGVAVVAVAAAACGVLICLCLCLCSCGSVYAQCGPSRS